jgi:DMSO reductase anchor subunit
MMIQLLMMSSAQSQTDDAAACMVCAVVSWCEEHFILHSLLCSTRPSVQNTVRWRESRAIFFIKQIVNESTVLLFDTHQHDPARHITLAIDASCMYCARAHELLVLWLLYSIIQLCFCTENIELSEGNTEKASLFTRAQFSHCHLCNFATLL